MRDNRDGLTTGCKVWFWLVIIANALTAIGGLALISTSPFLGISTVASGAALVVAAVMILFKYKKEGLYIIIGVCVINCLINIGVYNQGIVSSIISSGVSALISYYFVDKNGHIIR